MFYQLMVNRDYYFSDFSTSVLAPHVGLQMQVPERHSPGRTVHYQYVSRCKKRSGIDRGIVRRLSLHGDDLIYRRRSKRQDARWREREWLSRDETWIQRLRRRLASRKGSCVVSERNFLHASPSCSNISQLLHWTQACKNDPRTLFLLVHAFFYSLTRASTSLYSSSLEVVYLHGKVA